MRMTKNLAFASPVQQMFVNRLPCTSSSQAVLSSVPLNGCCEEPCHLVHQESAISKFRDTDSCMPLRHLLGHLSDPWKGEETNGRFLALQPEPRKLLSDTGLLLITCLLQSCSSIFWLFAFCFILLFVHLGSQALFCFVVRQDSPC